MTMIGVLLAGAGLVLLFAGIRGQDPRDVIVATITGRPLS